MSFKRLDPEDITISAEAIVAPAWSGQQTTLTAFYTSSTQVSTTGNYYYDIYQSTFGSTGAATQFSIAFGNRYGSGSTLINGQAGKTSTSVTYGQYRTLINGDENTDFTFGTTTPNSIFAITVARSRYKEKVKPGTLNLTLKSGSATIHLTDDSNTTTTVSYTDSGRVYNIISGSNGLPYSTGKTGFTAGSGSFGKFLPDIGVIILNGDAIAAPTGSDGGLGAVYNLTTSSASPNVELLYNMINLGQSFSLQSDETVTSNYVFVRVKNSEFNYSTNPSNITGSGELRWDVMVNSPQSYMTTVGLYNDSNDLLAVAKLSRPLLKDFTKEALVRIKLDY